MTKSTKMVSKSDMLRRKTIVKNAVKNVEFLSGEGDSLEGYIFRYFDCTRFKGRGLRWFPRGRRPLAIVPGLHYDLDLEDLEDIVGEEIEEDNLEDETEVVRGRTENYLTDSFVCVNGYLSDDECFESPKADRAGRRAQVIKLNAASERKKKKQKFELLTGPEVTGVLFWEGKGTVRAVFKKWKGIVFAGEPIPTGLSVDSELKRRALKDLNENRPNLPLPWISDDVLSILAELKADGRTSSSKPLGSKPAQNLSDHGLEMQHSGLSDLPILPPPTLNLQPAIPSREQDASYTTKYDIKYSVMNQVNQALLQRKSEESAASMPSGSWTRTISPESLMKTIVLDEKLTKGNQDLIWKYINKFYYKHIHENVVEL